MRKFFKPHGYWWHIWILSPFFRILLRLTNKERAKTKLGRKLRPFTIVVNDRENVPAKGPVIIAGNHLSFADPVPLWGALNRKSVFMAAAELWRNPLFGPVLRLMRHVPVKRGDELSHRKAENLFLRHLNAGGVAILYPEGKISRAEEGTMPPLLKFKRGVYTFANQTGAPVVPVGIVGTDLLLRPGSMKIHRDVVVTQNFGKPIYAQDFASAEEFLTELRLRIQKLSGQKLAGEGTETSER